MKQDTPLPSLEWPQVQWRLGNNLLSIISSLFGLFIFIFPYLNEKEFPLKFRLLIGLPLLLTPVIIPIVIWLCGTGRVAYLRCIYYSPLQQRIQHHANELMDTKKALFSVVEHDIESREFEIMRAKYEQGKLYIALKRRKSPKLATGDTLIAIHKEDGLAMGQFEVTEERSGEYHAIGVKGIDGLWLGFMKEHGETALLPYMTAIYRPSGEKQ
ncbi:MAG: hypothetical protein ICV60_05570 [Pyrinomonadaceae bacterium]|nr:hypothetical protein [Pyrinomonadaceae bacterium]